MKLRTELDDDDRLKLTTIGELSHDALAAHALLQALAEYEGAENGEANIYAMRIHRRADELMREWTCH